MNRMELANAIVKKKRAASRAEAMRMIDAVLDGITEGLRKSGSVKLTNFGTLEVVTRQGRKNAIDLGHYQRTADANGENGEVKHISTPSKNVVKFKIGKALNDIVQRRKGGRKPVAKTTEPAAATA